MIYSQPGNMVKFFVLAVLLLACIGIGPARADDTYSNPIYEETFTVRFAGKTMSLGIGDPTVIQSQGTYYFYATGDNFHHHVYLSIDLVNWQKGPQVFEAKENGLWAPDVFHNPDDGKFYLYYTVNQRIGVAIADRPDAVFKDQGALIADAIDAHMFRDEDGRFFLYYTTYPWLNIFVQEMAGPLIKKNTPPIRLLSPTEPWEKLHINVTEAPWVIKYKGLYYLIYSGGGSDSMDYAMGYALSTSPTGPFIRYSGNPIIKQGSGVFGPGHGSVITDQAGKLWMVYHQKYNAPRGWMRFIAIDPIWFDDYGVLHGRATRNQIQRAPVTGTGGKK